MNFIKTWTLAILVALAGIATANEEGQAATQLTEEQKQQQYREWAQNIWDNLDRQVGDIELANGAAKLQVPEEYYFLNPADSKIVLEQVWGNPPGAPVLGMLFPSKYTPFDGASWGVTIEYVEDGWVSDEEAAEIDYTELLEDLIADTKESSKQRVSMGYEPIELLGWAAEPFYDFETKKLHWAKEIRFGESQGTTLNYDIRVLGRKGYLQLTFIASTDQLEEINQSVDSVLAMANFQPGSQYADFDPSIDKVAAYGIGALVAGKVLAKTGIFVTLLLLLKKFWFVIAAAIYGIFKLLTGRKQKAVDQENKAEA